MAYDPGDIRPWWAHLRSSWTRCAPRAERTAAVNSWLAAAVLLRADASYGLQSISRRAARRRLAAAFTAGGNQFLVMLVTVVRLPSSAAALSVNMSITTDCGTLPLNVCPFAWVHSCVVRCGCWKWRSGDSEIHYPSGPGIPREQSMRCDAAFAVPVWMT